MKSGIEGAIRGGTLKEAKIVMLSRRQKSPYEIVGIFGAAAVMCGWQLYFDACAGAAGAGVEPVVPGWPAGVVGGGFAPKILAKRASLYTQIAMFTTVVEMNFAGPAVTVENDWSRSVEEMVSMTFAVRYVELYRV